MKIAIAAVLFDDDKRIGSQRARAFARELATAGHEVTVFTAGDPENRTSPFPGVEVLRLGVYDPTLVRFSGIRSLARKGAIATAIAGTVRRVRTLKQRRAQDGLSADEKRELFDLTRRRQSSVTKIDQLFANHQWTERALELIPDGTSRFDVVFSTFDPLGRALRNRGFARWWINDFRDPSVSEAFLRPVNAYLRRYQTSLLRDADLVTAISAGVKASLLKPTGAKRFANKIKVLSNGFSSRVGVDRPATADDSSAGPLKIGYTGQISPRQAPELRRFLLALREAADQIGPDSIEFHYAGRMGDLVASTCEEAGIRELATLHGMLEHPDALALQQNMDALLVLSHNNPGAEGILSGKFLEYLGSGKPIVAVVGGTLAGSELAEIVERCQVGICSERARGEKANRLLVDSLVDWARLRSAGEAVPFHPNQAQVDAYDYAYLAKRLTELAQRL